MADREQSIMQTRQCYICGNTLGQDELGMCVTCYFEECRGENT